MSSSGSTTPTSDSAPRAPTPLGAAAAQPPPLEQKRSRFKVDSMSGAAAPAGDAPASLSSSGVLESPPAAGDGSPRPAPAANGSSAAGDVPLAALSPQWDAAGATPGAVRRGRFSVGQPLPPAQLQGSLSPPAAAGPGVLGPITPGVIFAGGAEPDPAAAGIAYYIPLPNFGVLGPVPPGMPTSPPLIQTPPQVVGSGAPAWAGASFASQLVQPFSPPPPPLQVAQQPDGRRSRFVMMATQSGSAASSAPSSTGSQSSLNEIPPGAPTVGVAAPLAADVAVAPSGSTPVPPPLPLAQTPLPAAALPPPASVASSPALLARAPSAAAAPALPAAAGGTTPTPVASAANSTLERSRRGRFEVSSTAAGDPGSATSAPLPASGAQSATLSASQSASAVAPLGHTPSASLSGLAGASAAGLFFQYFPHRSESVASASADVGAFASPHVSHLELRHDDLGAVVGGVHVHGASGSVGHTGMSRFVVGPPPAAGVFRATGAAGGRLSIGTAAGLSGGPGSAAVATAVVPPPPTSIVPAGATPSLYWPLPPPAPVAGGSGAEAATLLEGASRYLDHVRARLDELGRVSVDDPARVVRRHSQPTAVGAPEIGRPAAAPGLPPRRRPISVSLPSIAPEAAPQARPPPASATVTDVTSLLGTLERYIQLLCRENDSLRSSNDVLARDVDALRQENLELKQLVVLADPGGSFPSDGPRPGRRSSSQSRSGDSL